MLGTLNGALEVREVHLGPNDIGATVQGVTNVVGGLPVLTGIEVRYRLRIPAGTREVVDRALATHQDKCPTAASLKGAVAVTWDAEIEEGE